VGEGAGYGGEEVMHAYARDLVSAVYCVLACFGDGTSLGLLVASRTRVAVSSESFWMVLSGIRVA